MFIVLSVLFEAFASAEMVAMMMIENKFLIVMADSNNDDIYIEAKLVKRSVIGKGIVR